MEALKIDYFERPTQNFKSDTTWHKDYEAVFKHLNDDNLLTTESLKKVILGSKPDTRTRERYSLALGVLAKFANLHFDTSLYSGKYSPKSRKPRSWTSDQKIAEWYEKITVVDS